MMDPPEHTRLRRLISGWFSARGTERLRPRIQQVTNDLLDEMAAHAPAADLVTYLSRPLPLTVICELLGIREADRDGFGAIVDRHHATTAYRPEEIAQARADLEAYFRQLIARLSDEPGSSLLATLIDARKSGDTLSEQELVDLAVVLLNAGHLTTVSELTSLIC